MADRFDEILTEMRREHDGWMAHLDRRQDQTDELIRFVGELNRRGEIALQDLLRGTAAMRAEIRESIKEMKANVEVTHGLAETTKAHTRAIFALIDRLEGGSGGLAPAS